MRCVVLVCLLLTSGARASVILPADIVADRNAPAAAWQFEAAAEADGLATSPSDMLGFALPPASTPEPAQGLLPSSVVPDVTSWTLLLLGMAIVGLAARRRPRSVTA